MNKQITLTMGLLAVVVDVATLLINLFVSPLLVPKFQTPDGWNALIVSGTFLLFVIGVFLIRRMKPSPQGASKWLTRGRRAGLALFFAFVVSLVIAWQLGFFASASQVDTTEMGEGGAASYFVFGPGAWLAFSLIYVLVFAFRVEPKIEFGGGSYIAAAIIGLCAAAAMLLIMAVQAQVIAQALEAVWAWAIAAFLILATLFLPVRLLYLSRITGLRSPASYASIASLFLLLGALATQMAR